jgi:hypothetical protein
MSVVDPTSVDLVGLRERLVARLERFKQIVRKHLLLEGVTRVLAIAVGLAILSYIVDRTLRLSLPARVVLLIAAIAYLVWEIWREILQPMLTQIDPVTLAHTLDQASKREPAKQPMILAPRVATVLELPQLLSTPAPPSNMMVERAVASAYQSLEGIDFDARVDERRQKFCFGLIAALVVIPLILTACSPWSVGLWAKRWFGMSNQPWPQKTYLSVIGLSGDSMVVPRGEPFVLRVAAKEGSLAPDVVSMKYREEGGKKTTVALTKFGANDFRYDFPPLQNPVQVNLSGGDDDMDPFKIEPIDRPKIATMELVSQHPTEPQATKHSFSGENADLSFLPKTNLELVFSSNVPIQKAQARSATTQPLPAELRQVDPQHFAMKWTHESPLQMEIELTGTGAGLTSIPTPIAVGLKRDQAPRVSLQFTGVRQRITPQAHIPLTIQARDDYAVGTMQLARQLDLPEAAKGTTQPIVPPRQLYPSTQATTQQIPQTDIQLQQTFNVAERAPVVGSLLQITASATDNCYLGPQTSLTRPITFRIVEPQELFREILVRQQGERAKFRKAIDDAQKIRDALTVMPPPDVAKQLAQQHRAIQRETNRIAVSMGQTLTEMKLNELGGPEAHELMETKVIKPMKGLDELMNPQREALDAIASDDQSKLADASARQDQLIERMKDILKNMSQWDSFVDVLNQLNEVIKIQTHVKETTETLKTKQTESIFEK